MRPSRLRPARLGLVLVALVALAFNLRPGAVSVGPVLEEVRAALHLNPAAAGLLTTLPVLCFAVFGGLAPVIGSRVGLHRLMLLALAAASAALCLRAWTGSGTVFLLLSVVALAGLATANVLIPSLVKLHYPRRIGLMTGVYSTSLAVGLTLASMATVPIGHALGSWRHGLLVWGLVAAVCAIPWVAMVPHDRRPSGPSRPSAAAVPFRSLASTRLGWAMAVAFGLQSLQAYSVFGWLAQVLRDSGTSSATAGLLLGLTTGVSIPISLLLPPLAARRDDQSPIVWGLGISFVAGYLGLIVSPTSGTALWCVLVGIGCGTFPLLLALIGLRARTSAGTASLSAFTQSVGYLIACCGPLMMGVLNGATGGWTVPLVVLIVLAGLQTAVTLLVARPRFIEDELTRA